MSTIERYKVAISTLDRERMIRVYLPSSYDDNKRFDVLYMHDGHNLFDLESSSYGSIWNVHTTLDMIENQYNKNVIVVGIDCDPINRLSEYSPWKNDHLHELTGLPIGTPNGGEGKQYVDWIVNELVPFINNKYKTTNINYMAGSSMGGLISLYAGFKYPNTFKKIGSFSPSIWFAKDELYKFIDEHYSKDLHVYIDIGSLELSFIPTNRKIDNDHHDVKDMEQYLLNKGSNDVYYVLDIGAKHNETAWSSRFPTFIKWLLEIK